MLVDLESLHGNFSIDLKYATHDNFTGMPVYQSQKAYLRAEAADKLQLALGYANAQGYGLRIFDPFRPKEAQYLLFNHTPDPDFLAHPVKGSPHSRGVAVDLTLYDLETQEDLDMGTGFDAFTPMSFHGADQISAEAHKNRYILLGIMTTAGFDFFRNEWWHYQLFNSKSYTLISDLEAPSRLLSKSQIEQAQELSKTFKIT